MLNHSAEVLEGLTLRKLFADFSEQGVRYAVLRNHEQLPDRVGSRDIDLLAHPGDLKRAKTVVMALASNFGLSVSDVFEDDMFFSIWFFRRVGEGLPFTLSIDIFPGRRVYGLELYSVEEALAGSRTYRGIPVVQERFVLLDKVMYHLAVGKPTHEKYDQLFARIARENHDRLVEDLAPFVGQSEARQRIDATAAGNASTIPGLSRQKRLLMLSRVMSHDLLSGIAGASRFLVFRVRDQFVFRGLFLSVSGPDGSGKTTVIDMVIAQLVSIYGEGAVSYAHFRPSILPRIAEVARKAGTIETVDENYDQPHRAKPSGIAGSVARLGYYWLDYIGGYFRSVRPVLKRREVMLFDRYYYDMIADSLRSRISLPMPLLRFMGRILPLPRYAFFINVDPEESYRRKQELTMERIVQLNQRYGDLARRGWLIAIDNNGAPEKAAAAIVDRIVQDRHSKAVRKLQ